MTILAIHRERFEPAHPPQAPLEQAPALDELIQRHEKSELSGIGLFARAKRANAKNRARVEAKAEYEQLVSGAENRRAARQAELDRHWQLLAGNDPDTVMADLCEAFEDNEATAAPLGIEDACVSLVVQVPGTDVIPQRKPGVTAAGNPSLRKMTKRESHDFYNLMVCGYIVVTVKEAFAVAPGLDEVGIVAVRKAPVDAYGARRPEAIAAARFNRSALEGIQWDQASSAQVFNDAGHDKVLVQRGASGELKVIDITKHPQIGAALQAVDLDEAPTA